SWGCRRRPARRSPWRRAGASCSGRDSRPPVAREAPVAMRTAATLALRSSATLLFALSLVGCAPSAPPLPSPRAEPPVGIVLMHGKKGPPSYLQGVNAVLEGNGYLVTTPEMCWSDKRMYDRPYLDCLTEIDAAVATLRQRGAKAIVV